MDWKKKYHFSDLFARDGGRDAPAGFDGDAAGGREEQAPSSVWKKEIRLSSLFRRSKPPKQRALPPFGETSADGPAPAEPAAEAPPAPSIWKKEIKLSSLFKRRRPTRPIRQQLALPPAGGGVGDAPVPPAEEFRAPAAESPPSDAAAEETGTAPSELAGETAAAEARTEPVDQAPAEDRESGPKTAADGASREPDVMPPHDGAREPAGAAAEAGEASAASAADEETSGAEAPPADTAPAASESEPVVIDVGGASASTRRKGGFLRKEIRLGRRRPKPAKERGPERRERPRPVETDPVPQRRESPKPSGAPSGAKLPEVPLMRALNLLPQDVKLAKTTLRPAFAHAAVVFVALAVAGAMGFLYFTRSQQVAERESTVEDLEVQIAAIEEVDEGAAGSGGAALAGEALSRATALSAALKQRLGWDRLLRELSLTLPEGVWFDGMSTAGAGVTPVPASTEGSAVPSLPAAVSSLTITGYSMDQQGIAQLLARLETVPEFSSVALQSATRVEIAETPVIQFNVVGTLK